MSQGNPRPAITSAADFGQYALAAVRIVIGWHFLYEGIVKVLYPGWTSVGYLRSSAGPFADFFRWLGANETLVRIVDQFNIWGLILIGLALMLGLLIRQAAAGGIALLALYYFAYPPSFGPVTPGGNEGHYLVVNKNLIELVMLMVVAAFPAVRFGLDGLFRRHTGEAVTALPAAGMDQPVPAYFGPMSRREVFAGMAGVPFLGALLFAVLKKHGWKSIEEAQLSGRSSRKDNFVASASVKSFQFSNVGDLKGRLPRGKIGNVSLSRMILGGNLMGGWAHARDLIYVSKLIKSYHHREKIFETFALAESCSVNTILTNPALCDVINDYWRNGGRIQFISDCGGKDVLAMTKKSIDRGACACYIQGGVADRLVAEGKFDLISQTLELVRKNGLPAGIGGHKLETIKTCVEKGLWPDFWMKTLHHVNYWSASTKPEHDNIWCDDPIEVAAFMRQLKQPWIAFKILAAGAIEPKVAFKWAFEHGADFICVGMYDFQIVDDVNLAVNVLSNSLVRQREWFA